MRFRAFGVRVTFIVGVACVILLLQMLAVSRLSSSQTKAPWREREEAQGTARSSSLEHEKPPGDRKKPSLSKASDTPTKGDKIQVRKARDGVVRHVQQLENSSHSLPDLQKDRDDEGDKKQQIPDSVWRGKSTEASTATDPTVSSVTHTMDFKPFPVPSEHKNCDIKGKKDALSAISRATSQECKDLIHNITCIQKAGLLYDTDLRKECGTHNPGRNLQVVPLTGGSGPTARIVYLFSVHGRAFRQVKRLLKAIYHTDHYYFIHVDSRSDYLHHKLYEALSDYPNIYFPTWRMATIWGGASLLQMLLRALEDLEFVLTNWKWDYFINLSESDYPLKTNTELVNFLKVHRGSNFVKTHGGDIKKFIQKQGLDRTFVQCDSHMWRVDNRKLPGDIVIDGGSDWIAIHRNYSRYLVTDRSSYLTGLKRYYEFSLLPAESFFHTVLRNGPMCDTFVKTNLRVTNWNRKLGCRCQYKHIVDWCGCSPNDFLTKDFGRVSSPGDHHFFARKFEAIVNHDIINRLDTHLYGVYPDNTPAITSFWESVYHDEDDLNFPYNARYSTYQSFLRQALLRFYSESKTVNAVEEKCEVPRQAAVKEVTVLRVQDSFKGLVVTLKDGMSTSLSPPELEVLYTPVDYLQKYTISSEIAKRIWSFKVGTDWDGKESIFRNYGGIIGVWDDPVAAIHLNVGKQGEVNIVWDDPTGERVATHTIKLEANWFVTYHKPKFDRPICPGVWNTRVELADGSAIMETKFLVVPLTHENMKVMDDPASVNAKRADDPHLMEARGLSEWKENVKKTGESLEQWLDKLVSDFWKIEGICRTDSTKDGCSYTTDCAYTDWSTFSPDPKSELGEVKWDGRIR